MVRLWPFLRSFQSYRKYLNSDFLPLSGSSDRLLKAIPLCFESTPRATSLF